jgi:hypothetical protein
MRQKASDNGAEQQMKQRRLTIISLLCAFLSPLGAGDLGPPIGSQFPERSVKSKLGPKGALISVSQSAGPGPSEIQQNQEASRKLGLGMAAVSSKIHPGWYVLDARGVIVAKYPDDEAGGHFTPAAVLVRQFGWTPPEPAVEVEGKQLTAKAGASNATVAPGERVALMLDIDLQPDMHVYAPGVDGYIPIDWKMQDSQTAAVHPAIFPRSQKLFLKAINETVPAYRNHFRLTRDITIGRPIDGSGKFTVPGSLRYQACDDRVCYIPQELHLTWTFQYEAPKQP